MIPPSGSIIAGVPLIPSFSASLRFSSIADVTHFGAGRGYFAKASSRRERDFSHTMALAFSYAPLCIGNGYIFI